MAIGGTKARLLVDEFDFSGDTNSVTVNTTIGEEECTVLTSTASEHAPILPSMTIEQTGYLSGVDTDGFEAELRSRMGVEGSYVAALFGIDTPACPAYVLDDTFGAAMNIQAPAAGLMTLNGSWGVARGGNRGLRIFQGVLNATGDQAIVNFQTGTNAGGNAFLFVQAIGGTANNASIKVKAAATGDGSYTDRATFTVSAVGGYKAALTSTVSQFVRLSVDSLGGATSLTVVCIVCTNGVTQ